MPKSFKYMDIRLIDESVQPMALAGPRPSNGWVKTIREAIGMTRAQLAQRLGISLSTINTLERSEARGTISIASLEKLANGLGGRLVYAIVPRDSRTFEQMVNERAEKIARRRLARVSHTMKLEDQSVEAKHEEFQLKRIAASLLEGSRRNLWR